MGMAELLCKRATERDDGMTEQELDAGKISDAPAGDTRTASIGLCGLSDWSTSYPFIDVFKTSRTWLGHTPAQWGAYQFEDFDTDADGWVRSLPAGVDFAEALLLVDLPAEMTFAAGIYDVTWEGEGRVTIGSGATNIVQTGAHSQSFEFSPDGGNNVSIAVSDINPTGYPRNLKVIKRDHAAAYTEGRIFNPTWVETIRGARSIRFMDWQATNNSPVSSWSQRTLPSSVGWIRGGAPLEIMVALANEIEADPWFCFPHLADNDYVKHFSEYVRDYLDPRLTAYFEYSNEIWNFSFGQAAWLQNRARGELRGVRSGWIQLGGIRAAEVANIVAGVFADRPSFKRVIGVQTGWLGLEDPLLNAPDYRALHPSVPAPSASFDAYAVTGYFDGEMSLPEKLPDIREWIEESTPGTFDVAIAKAVANIRSSDQGNSLAHLYANWAYHKGVADTYGYELVMYEGGSHTIVPDDSDGELPDGNWEELGDFYEALNYSPEMAVIYRDAMNQWERIGGLSFNAFVDISYPSRHGFWGALRYLGDETLKWNVIAGDRLLDIPEQRVKPYNSVEPASLK